MKVEQVEAYRLDYVNKPERSTTSFKESGKTQDSPVQAKQEVKAQAQSLDDLLTRRERDFFIQMFPESSEQLSRHVLFNRNGKIQQAPAIKGLIFDGKA